MKNSNKFDSRLFEAITTHDIQSINQLIEEGIDVNQFDMANDDFTSLMLAINLNLTDVEPYKVMLGKYRS